MGGFLIINCVVLLIALMLQVYASDRNRTDTTGQVIGMFLIGISLCINVGITIWYYANIWPILIAQETLKGR